MYALLKPSSLICAYFMCKLLTTVILSFLLLSGALRPRTKVLTDISLPISVGYCRSPSLYSKLCQARFNTIHSTHSRKSLCPATARFSIKQLQNGKKTSRLKAVGGGGGGTAGVVDARLKIIEKTRSKLVDARDRLNQRLRQTDARERIMMRSNSAGVGNISVNTRNNLDIIPRRTVPNQQSTLPPTYSRRGGGGGDPLYRTIKNRQPTVSAPPRPTAYMDLDAPENWNNRLANLPRLEIHVPRNIVREREDWLRHGKPNSLYRSKDDIKSRLDSSRQEGYRIVVSNLQPTVTHEDIKELFEDIGTLIGSRVVRPGTAEVVYKNVDDALTAVDTYHNRQLDGQPMKCLLVKPTNSNSRNLSTKGSIVPDLNTVHKALFTK